jgi:hypothetical protein
MLRTSRDNSMHMLRRGIERVSKSCSGCPRKTQRTTRRSVPQRDRRLTLVGANRVERLKQRLCDVLGEIRIANNNKALDPPRHLRPRSAYAPCQPRSAGGPRPRRARVPLPRPNACSDRAERDGVNADALLAELHRGAVRGTDSGCLCDQLVEPAHLGPHTVDAGDVGHVTCDIAGPNRPVPRGSPASPTMAENISSSSLREQYRSAQRVR